MNCFDQEFVLIRSGETALISNLLRLFPAFRCFLSRVFEIIKKQVTRCYNLVQLRSIQLKFFQNFHENYTTLVSVAYESFYRIIHVKIKSKFAKLLTYQILKRQHVFFAYFSNFLSSYKYF